MTSDNQDGFTLSQDIIARWRAFQPSSAVFSEDRRHRYWLIREIGPEPERRLTFIMLNPSTATETKNDPTVKRCINFATRWGYGTLVVVNIFAYRATKPAALRDVDDPVGPENNAAILKAVVGAERVICAWGAGGKMMDRSKEVRRMLQGRELYVLGLTKEGYPRHPLYVAHDVEPVLWN
jgi:hypothetical protein